MMRTGGYLILAFLLVTPAAMAVSTRFVHDTLADTFVPPPADAPAVPATSSVNCNHPANNGLGLCDGLVSFSNTEATASPPFYTCVADNLDLDIAIQNPFPIHHTPATSTPNQAKSQGLMSAHGSFFVVPEISGADAGEVTSVWFGFLETVPQVATVGGASDELCQDDAVDNYAVSTPGAYYEFYRGDTDASDGWLIPVNTLLVPDNLYGAHLRLFGGEGLPGTGGSELLATGFVYAIVDNVVNDETWRPCTPTTATCNYQDITPPWATVTPGDVPLASVSGNQLEVSFGEHVVSANTVVKVNGNQLKSPSIAPTMADVDSVPLFEVLTDEWGPTYTFQNVNLNVGDVVTVTATDNHGNEATKTVTIS